MRRFPVVTAGLLSLLLTAPVPAQAAASTQVTSVAAPSAPVDLETSPGAIVRAHIVDPVGLTPGDPVDDISDTTDLSVNTEGGAVGG